MAKVARRLACSFYRDAIQSISVARKLQANRDYFIKYAGYCEENGDYDSMTAPMRPNSRSQFKITSKSVQRPPADKCYIAPAMHTRRNVINSATALSAAIPARHVTIKNVRMRKWTRGDPAVKWRNVTLLTAGESGLRPVTYLKRVSLHPGLSVFLFVRHTLTDTLPYPIDCLGKGS